MPKVGSKLKRVGENKLYTRVGARKILQKNPGIISLIKKAIATKNISWEHPTTISKKPLIKIQRAATGRFQGSVNYNRKLFGEKLGTFRITIGKKSYFLKHSAMLSYKLIEKHEKTRELLQKIQNKVGPFNVRLVEPHIIFLPKNTLPSKNKSTQGFLVTRFFEDHEVTQISESELSKRESLESASKTLSRMLSKNKISNEMRLLNLFYEKKTNTLWVYDL